MSRAADGFAIPDPSAPTAHSAPLFLSQLARPIGYAPVGGGPSERIEELTRSGLSRRDAERAMARENIDAELQAALVSSFRSCSFSTLLGVGGRGGGCCRCCCQFCWLVLAAWVVLCVYVSCLVAHAIGFVFSLGHAFEAEHARLFWWLFVLQCLLVCEAGAPRLRYHLRKEVIPMLPRQLGGPCSLLRLDLSTALKTAWCVCVRYELVRLNSPQITDDAYDSCQCFTGPLRRPEQLCRYATME
eukprot:TRINITY_DN47314_c2_g1_i2.p1 TRINITY_DN47314_c2_g1~~TRINITY_DN47314_c2_g1_i2.p1  ORF type:complete len:244 (-),score=15.70 TRINITY_DN47314_c2_g1_i2:167-898(-)